MTNKEIELLEIIGSRIEYKLDCLNWCTQDIGFWLDGLIYNLSVDYSAEFYNELYALRDYYLVLED